MQIKSSAGVIREMRADTNKAINELNTIASQISTVLQRTRGWTDRQSLEFNEVLRKIAALSKSPVPALENTQRQLEQLAQILDRYNNVRF